MHTGLQHNMTLISIFGHVAILFATIYIALNFYRTYKRQSRKAPQHRHALVLVFGDLTRSPRMCYHAQSLANQANYHVHLVGFYDAKKDSESLIEAIRTHPRIRIYALPKPTSRLSPTNHEKAGRFWRTIQTLTSAITRILLQSWHVLLILAFALPATMDVIFVQNPPAIPALFWVQMYRLLSNWRCKIFLDWHNLGYTILELAHPPESLLVKLYRTFERTFGHYAYCHLTVTNAMRTFLLEEWCVQGRVVVLYDRAPLDFHPFESDEDKGGFMGKFFKDKDNSIILSRAHQNLKNLSDLIINWDGEVNSKRPLRVISSTSWTADEDFGILWDALQMYDADQSHLEPSERQPLIVIITGKGPLKSHWSKIFHNTPLLVIKIFTAWLSAADYPRILAASDFGICLHTSSSGLDLPMKVVDMFGSGLPVLAVGYPTLSELVLEDVNGLTFMNAAELLSCIKQIINPSTRRKLSKGTNAFQQLRWDESWKTVLPLLNE